MTVKGSTIILAAAVLALAAVKRAVVAGQLDRQTAARHRAEIARSARLIRRLPRARGNRVAVALGQVAGLSGQLTRARAVAIFGQLKANNDYFALHWAPRGGTDIRDADGIVYRYFVGQCFEFHPLANFGKLNSRVALRDVEGTQRLATALAARGVYRTGGASGWEYYFNYGGGRAPWISGMAQAVAAQALARAAALLPTDAEALMEKARSAYGAIPGRLLTTVAGAPWIRLYSFSATPVLNAQLQAALSVETYAKAAGDAAAASLAERLKTSAALSLWRFDTGYWTYYALPHAPSPLHYQRYVVELLKKLARDDSRFAGAAARFEAYERQPPAFKVASGGVGELRFWLSKPATVQADSDAGRTKWLSLGGGWHTLSWSEPRRPGAYAVRLSALDWAGNRAGFQSLPVVRAVARHAAAPAPTIAPGVGLTAFSVGAGVDDPVQAVRAQQLGLRLVRVGVDWPPGATAPDSALVTALRDFPPGMGAMIELHAAPADGPARTALAAYAASLAQQLPALRVLILAPAPAAAGASRYAAALAAVRAAVQSVSARTAVGPAIDGAASPETTVAALGGDALRDYNVVAFRPAAVPASGRWTAADVPRLVSTLQRSGGERAPRVLLDGLAAPSGDGTAYAAAIKHAACSAGVAGVILDRLIDNSATSGPRIGVIFADGRPKDSAAAVAAAARPAQRGTLVCAGVARATPPSSLSFATELVPGAGIVLGCLRDCLYLVTLEDWRGRPVVATRGALRGGGHPVTIRLPKTKLRDGTYRIGLRLVDQVNPGPVTRLMSPPLRPSP